LKLIRQWVNIGRCFLAMVTILRLTWGADEGAGVLFFRGIF
jgi:hypothetical protein